MHISHTPAADPRPCVAVVPSLVSQYHTRSNSDSSTSSGEGYCNDPSSKPPPWSSQVFSSEKSPLTEQPPNLELAGSQAVFSGNHVSFQAPNPVSDLPRRGIKPWAAGWLCDLGQVSSSLWTFIFLFVQLQTWLSCIFRASGSDSSQPGS